MSDFLQFFTANFSIVALRSNGFEPIPILKRFEVPLKEQLLSFLEPNNFILRNQQKYFRISQNFSSIRPIQTIFLVHSLE